MPSVAVIGAGAAGLAACRRLLSGPTSSTVVTLFDRRAGVGGAWVYPEEGKENDEGRGDDGQQRRGKATTPMYRNLCTNLPTAVMAFPGLEWWETEPSLEQEVLPLEGDWSAGKEAKKTGYVHRRRVLDYLQRFSAQFLAENVRSERLRVRLGTEVTAVRSVEDSSSGLPCFAWEPVPSSPGGQGRSGSEARLSGTKWRVAFRPLQGADSTLLPQSNASSQGQLSEEVFDAVVVANGHYERQSVPSDIPGLDAFPGRVFPSFEYDTPDEFDDQVVVVIGGGPSATDIVTELVKRGGVREIHWSIKYPKAGILEAKAPASGVLRVQSILENVFEDGTVTFVGENQQCTPDTIIVAAGYELNFPFLGEELARKENPAVRITDSGRNVWGVWRQVFSVTNPSLAFIGLPFRIAPFPLFDRQACFLARVWNGRPGEFLQGTSAMKLEEEQEYDQRTRLLGYPRHYKHCMGDLQWGYNTLLAQESGVPPISPHVRALYNASALIRGQRPLGEYRAAVWRVNVEESTRTNVASLVSSQGAQMTTQKTTD